MPAEYQSNAMTEIALALAMAFFSIMVLAMISMGSAMQIQNSNGSTLAEGIFLSISGTPDDGNSAATRTVAPDQMIIHWHGRFYDGALRLIDPTSLASAGHRVLAIAPDLSITEAMGVREMIAIADLEVTTLDTRWIQNLEERDP
jgi:hypothetical protein